MTLNEKLDALCRHIQREGEYGPPTPRLVCEDGFTVSVQAGQHVYCSPRVQQGPWHEVELGFPSERVDEWMEYIDGGPDDDPTNNVYGYVPIELVATVLDKHGWPEALS